MRRIDRLIHEANEAATWRGHDMTRFGRHHATDTGRTSAHAFCRVCGRMASVDTHPMPNGIDIWGEAVALGCVDNTSGPS